jgi:hypothetical protein
MSSIHRYLLMIIWLIPVASYMEKKKMMWLTYNCTLCDDLERNTIFDSPRCWSASASPILPPREHVSSAPPTNSPSSGPRTARSGDVVARGHQWDQGRVIVSLDASMAHRLISSSPTSSRKPEEEVAPEEEVTQDRELKSTPADTSEFHNIDHRDNSSNNHDY